MILPFLKTLILKLKNETVALVGESGSGKTSLVDMLTGILKPNSGTLLLDKAPFDDIAMLRWRSKIGYVSQDHPIFSGTILSNVIGSNNFDNIKNSEISSVWKALELANMADFVEIYLKALKQMLVILEHNYLEAKSKD